MKRLGIALLFAGFTLACQGAGTGADGRVGRDLVTATEQLVDAVGRGDRTVWEKYLSSDFAITDETGSRLDRAQFLGRFRPQAAGKLQVTEPKVLLMGDVAVVTHRDRGPSGAVAATDTWVRRGPQWRLLAAHRSEVRQ
jgi:Domain of unknown function (DUF4440)